MKLKDIQKVIDIERTLNFLSEDIFNYIKLNYPNKLEFGYRSILVKWGINDNEENPASIYIWREKGNYLSLIYTNDWRTIEDIARDKGLIYINIPIEYICDNTWKEFIDEKYA